MEGRGDWSLGCDPRVAREGGDADRGLPDERGVHVLVFSTDERKQDPRPVIRYDIAVPVPRPSAPSSCNPKHQAHLFFRLCAGCSPFSTANRSDPACVPVPPAGINPAFRCASTRWASSCRACSRELRASPIRTKVAGSLRGRERKEGALEGFGACLRSVSLAS